MNFSIIAFLLYLALLGGTLFWARRSTESKRAMIKEHFKWEDHQIRSTGYDDPRIRKFTLTGWSLAFVMAGVLLIPVADFGDSIWTQILVVLGMEFGFLLAGLLIIKEVGIVNWYLECYVCNFHFYLKALGSIILAIFIANIALFIPFNPFGFVAQMMAVGVMAIALYFIISPILREEIYYT